jgi:hypothetical protein
MPGRKGRVPSRSKSATPESIDRDRRLARFIADCLAVRNTKPFIRKRIREEFGLPWSDKTLNFFIDNKISQDDHDQALARLERGEIIAAPKVVNGRQMLIVESERPIAFAPVSGPKRVNENPTHRLNTLRALADAVEAGAKLINDKLNEAEEALREGTLSHAESFALETALRSLAGALAPVALDAAADIKDRDTRLSVLASIAFNQGVKESDRVKAVEVSSRILGDFQRARANDHDVSLKQLAERIVTQGMERTGLPREQVVKMIAKTTPEITQWLSIRSV